MTQRTTELHREKSKKKLFHKVTQRTTKLHRENKKIGWCTEKEIGIAIDGEAVSYTMKRVTFFLCDPL